jgi:hypothetical protein
VNKHADKPIINIANPLHYRMAKAFLKDLHERRKDVCLVVFDVHEIKDWRTLSQNAYLHGVVFVWAARGMTEAFGRPVTMLEAKDVLKERFLRVPFVDANGEARCYITRSTAELDKAEMSVFIDNCIQWCDDFLNVKVPPPDQFGDEWRDPEKPRPGDVAGEDFSDPDEA